MFDVKPKIICMECRNYSTASTNGTISCVSIFQGNIFSTTCAFRYPQQTHYNDVIMTTMASQITSLTVVYADQRKHQSSVLLALCAGTSPGPVNSPHKGPVTRKMFPFDDVSMSRGRRGDRHRYRMCFYNACKLDRTNRRVAGDLWRRDAHVMSL